MADADTFQVSNLNEDSTLTEGCLTPDQDIALLEFKDALYRCVLARVPPEFLADAAFDIALGELFLTIKDDDRLTVCG